MLSPEDLAIVNKANEELESVLEEKLKSMRCNIQGCDEYWEQKFQLIHSEVILELCPKCWQMMHSGMTRDALTECHFMQMRALKTKHEEDIADFVKQLKKEQQAERDQLLEKQNAQYNFLKSMTDKGYTRRRRPDNGPYSSGSSGTTSMPSQAASVKRPFGE